jgi:ribosomal protein L35
MNKKYKIKTHKGFKKRFFLTKSKKVKFFSCGLRHGLSNKSRKHNRALKKNKYLKTSSKSLIKKMIFFI